MNFYPKDYDTKKLYPVQKKKGLPKIEIPFGGEDEKIEGGDGKSAKNSKSTHRNGSVDGNFSPRRVSNISAGLSTDGVDRRPSMAAALKRLSILPPPPTVTGPDGRPMSTRVDYGFYDSHVVKRGSQTAPSDQDVPKHKEAFQKSIEAMKHIRLKGLRDFALSVSWVARIFWLLLFILCVTILAIEIKKAVHDYQTKPLTTTFTIKTPPSIKFPQIYICFGNALNRTYIRQHPEAVAGIANVYQMLAIKGQKRKKRSSDPSIPWNDDIEQDMPGDDQIWRLEHEIDYLRLLGMYGDVVEQDSSDHGERHRRSATTQNQTDLEQWLSDGDISYNFLLNAGFKVPETFLDCSFYGYSRQQYNCTEIIKTVIDMNYYMCYVIELPQDTTQVVARRGLQLLINSQLSLYAVNRTKDTKPNGYAGLFVSVSDTYDASNWQKGVVAPGTYTKFSISANHIKLLNTDRGTEPQRCIENGLELFNVFNVSTYSRTACQMDCMWDTIIRHCNCVMHIDKQFVKTSIMDRTPLCSFHQKQSCIAPKMANSTSVQTRIERCSSHCLAPCDSVHYDMIVSSSPLNQGSFPAGVNASEMIKLDIAFGRLEISELFQSESKTLSQMIADMGGQVNLWLGASMIILIEISIFMFGYLGYIAYQETSDMIWRHRFLDQ